MGEESITQLVADNFDNEQAGLMLTILGRMTALQHLVAMLWTDRFAQTGNPVKEAEQLKERVLALTRANLDDPFEEQAHNAMAELLGLIIAQVESL